MALEGPGGSNTAPYQMNNNSSLKHGCGSVMHLGHLGLFLRDLKAIN